MPGDEGRQKNRAGAIDHPAFLALISDQALRRLIITGRPDFRMPDFAGIEGRGAGFEPLTGEQIEQIVRLLASWRDHPPETSDRHAEPPRSDSRE